MTLKEYKPGSTFPGTIGRTVEESQPAWPAPLRAKPNAQNVLFIILDDVGFAQLGCFGSPIATPNLDRLAGEGLRYAAMHTTALCSPSRSCIITGRNHHSNAMAGVTEISTGYPGYNGNIPFENGFLSEILLKEGYNTFAIGKWHLTPTEQTSAAGPYDRWPLGCGFERYYGFLGGDTHQYYPDLVYDNHQVDPPRTPEQGYHLTEDLVDKAIHFISDAKQVAPDKPFFLQFCTGAGHAPHHVPREWSDKYRGKFDAGWDAYREKALARQIEMGFFPKGTQLSAHDPDVQNWDALPENERRLYARMMEVYAGFLEHTDHHIGRLIDFLERTGELDKTLIMVISDNGASAEGGPHGTVNEVRFFNFVPESLDDNLKAIDELGGPKYFNHYPWGWAWAGDAPFRRWKRETYRGGTTDPFIVHWPNGIKAKGEIRQQYTHAIDMVPTVLDALGIEPPATIKGITQSPIQGHSFTASFNDQGAVGLHRTQYFEMFGHRAIYHDGWRAVCPVPGPSFAEAGIEFGKMTLTVDKLRELDAHGWELYHVAEDPSERHNVAQQNPDRVREMVALWYVEAGKYNVLPLDSRGQERIADERPLLSVGRDRYVYYADSATTPEGVAPRVLNRPHSITADVEIPKAGAHGVLLSQGGVTGGYSLFMRDGKLHYVHNYVGAQEFKVSSDALVPAGKHQLRFEFEPTGQADIRNGKGTPGRAQLYVDDQLVGQSDIPVTVPILVSLEGLSCGRDAGSPVCSEYEAPFPFTGTINQVVLDLSGELIEDTEAAMRVAMARQ